jgi:large subunit ribosomal protein L4
MKVIVKDSKGNSQGELEVKFPVIENGRGTQAVHDVVVAFRAGQRSGTACTKNVGEVAGTNKKPWRQKGTGRARAGSFQSPLWRGGGVVFGPKPRDFAKKVNGKIRHLALLKAMSERVKSGDVIVVDELKLSSPKTKEFLGVLRSLGVADNSVLLVFAGDKTLALAARNVPRVHLAESASLNTYQLLLCDKLIFTRSAYEQFEQRLTRN